MTGGTRSLLNRSQAPPPGTVRPFDFPEVHSTHFPSGLGLRVARMTQVPLVTLSVVLRGGESVLPDARAGLAVLTGAALEGGTLRRSGPELAEAFEGIGTGLSVQTGWDATRVSVTCLADRKEEAMALLAEALLEPAFPEGELDRFRNQRLAAIQQRLMDPGRLADDSAAHFFFSDSTPYHRPVAGTQASVEQLDPGDVQEFWESFYLPRSAGLVVVGDVDIPEVERMAGTFFGGWEGAPKTLEEFESEARSPVGRIVVVHRPGSVQSEIRIGQPAAARNTPLYFPLQVFNTILGGAFTSRLMLNLREVRGYTYGIRSRFGFRSKEGPFSISTAVATEVTAPAVRESVSELKGLIREGPTPDEVRQARDFIAGVFPLQLETTGQVASSISELILYQLEDDYFSTYRDRIRAVTAKEVQAASQEVLRPDEMVVVVVGDAERVRGPLADLDLGPMEVVTPG
ncbi:MAG: M16 family metallopeptidase [Gemmatimonadota bacterium]